MDEWENEPDHDEFIIRGMSYVFKPHKKKRIRKKYRNYERYDLQPQIIDLHCSIDRHPQMKHLCGYVSVPQQHPLWGKNAFYLDIEVHGGLTFGQKRKKSFRFGFDCAHYGDCIPDLYKGIKELEIKPMLGTYRNMAYVKREIISLADQLLTQGEKVNVQSAT